MKVPLSGMAMQNYSAGVQGKCHRCSSRVVIITFFFFIITIFFIGCGAVKMQCHRIGNVSLDHTELPCRHERLSVLGRAALQWV